MPRIIGRKDVHHLYSPKSRRQEFSRADWRFLIHASANIARAFAVIHNTGCVIGDVNQGGVLIAQDATVRLIDCDSFQLVSGGRKFLCEVGVETFTPPELQGRSFAGVVRTANHDNFGLAVMIFLMLFMGRHPFSGRYLGSAEMPLSKAIREYRFAYSIRPQLTQMQRPPGTPPLPIVGTELGVMFERAFEREGSLGNRPGASDWAIALDALEKRQKQCSANPAHWHLAGLLNCPWCAMEGASNVSLFPIIMPPDLGSGFNFDAFWNDVESVVSPGPPPQLDFAKISPSKMALTVGRASKKKPVAGLAAVAIFFTVLFAMPQFWPLALVGGLLTFFGIRRIIDRPEEFEKIRIRKDKATSTWAVAQQAWGAQSSAEPFEEKRRNLDRLRREWDGIPSVRNQRLQKLRIDQRRLQLERFLDRFEIDKAKISGIGAGRKQTLESFGIETAADITVAKIDAVPGFGPALRKSLLDWRNSIEGRFRFDPRQTVDPRDIARVEQEVLAERRRIQVELTKALAELRQVRGQIFARRVQLKSQVEAAQKEYLQALADFQAARF
jgi:DNA-binding helix-hairpin-helix protein with protein kinase domain